MSSDQTPPQSNKNCKIKKTEKPIINTFNLLNQKLQHKYSSGPISYNSNLIECLIFNKNSHYSSTFRDWMLYDYIDEYLKRFYNKNESANKLPKLSRYYINYLSFFLRPVFRDFYVNSSLKKYGENKAELYYYCQYGKKPPKEDELSNTNCKEHNCMTLLTEEVRKKIDKNSFLNQSSKKLDDISSVYYFGEMELKSGLHTLRDHQESIMHILSVFESDTRQSKEIIRGECLVKNESGEKKGEPKNIVNSNGCSQENIQFNENEKLICQLSHKFDLLQNTSPSIDKIKQADENLSRNKLQISKSRNYNNNIYNLKPTTSTSSLEQIKNGLNKIININNKTRNRSDNYNIEKTNSKNQQDEFPKTQTTSEHIRNHTKNFNLTKTFKDEKNNLNRNFFEKVQFETLKALQKIKKSKFEFKKLVSNKKNNNNNFDQTINNTNVGSQTDLKVSRSTNKKGQILNDYLTLTYNNIHKVNKMESKCSLNFYPGTCPTETRREKNEKLLQENPNHCMKDSLSPNTRENGNTGNKFAYNSTYALSINSFNNLYHQTQALSRNKNSTLLGCQTSKQSLKNEESKKKQNLNYFNNLTSGVNPSSNKTYSENPSNPYYSFKNEKSNISGQNVNKNISKNLMSTNIEELQEKIYGTFQTNYKYIKTILNKSKEKNQTKKSLEMSRQEKKKTTKTTSKSTKVHYLYNDNSRNISNTNLLTSKTSINKVLNGCGPSHQNLVNNKIQITTGGNFSSNLSSSKDSLLINHQKNPAPTTILKIIKGGNSNNQIKKSSSNLLSKATTHLNSKSNQTQPNELIHKNKKSIFTKLNGGGLVQNQMNSKEKKFKNNK